MKFRHSQALDRDISTIGFGTWSIGGEIVIAKRQVGMGPVDSKAAIAALHHARELGINFFDTADVYGIAEDFLGTELSHRPEQIIIATKAGIRESADGSKSIRDFSEEYLTEALETSLRRLKRSYVDIFLLHSPPDTFNWSEFDPTIIEKLKQQGKIRAFGVSCHGFRGAERVMELPYVQIVETIYNALDRRAEEKALPLAQQRKIDVIARVPLAQGFLSGQYRNRFAEGDIRSSLPQKDVEWRKEMGDRLTFLGRLPGGQSTSALRFSLSSPAVLTVIPGMRNEPQVTQNAQASELGPLPESVLEEIRAAVPTPYEGWG